MLIKETDEDSQFICAMPPNRDRTSFKKLKKDGLDIKHKKGWLPKGAVD